MSTKSITKGIALAASAFQEFRPMQHIIPQNQTNTASCPSTSRAKPHGNLVKYGQCSNTMPHGNACNSRNTHRCFLQRMGSSHQLRRQTDTAHRYHNVPCAPPPFLEAMRRPNVSRHTSMVPSHPYRPRTPPYLQLQQRAMSDAPWYRLSHDIHSAPNVSMMRRNIPTMHQNIPTMHQNAPTMQQNAPTMQQNLPKRHQDSPTIHQNISTVPQTTPTMQQSRLIPTRYQNVSTVHRIVPTMHNGFVRQQVFYHAKETYVLTYTNEGNLAHEYYGENSITKRPFCLRIKDGEAEYIEKES